MKQTTNLALNLPEQADPYNVEDYNENFKILDKKISEISGGGIPTYIPLYAEAIEPIGGLVE